MKEWTDELKDPVFRIPEGYFEKLNDRLDQRIASSRQMRGRIVRMRLLRWSSAAAVIAALAIGIGLHLHTQANSNPQIALSGEEARDIASRRGKRIRERTDRGMAGSFRGNGYHLHRTKQHLRRRWRCDRRVHLRPLQPHGIGHFVSA